MELRRHAAKSQSIVEKIRAPRIEEEGTRIEFFRKNYREIHGNQRIPKFPAIFTVFTVIFTGNRGNFYRNSR